MSKKDTTIFEDLMNLYTSYYDLYDDMVLAIEHHKEKENWAALSDVTVSKGLYDAFGSELKDILKTHFKTQISMEIPLLEEKYNKEKEFSASAWSSYGSELAGDFNKGEKAARKKLTIYKSILD